MDARELPLHPVAEIFPEMGADQYAAFRADIHDNGPREKAWTWRGSLIDGRHRQRACRELGITCPSQEWTGDESGLVAFVVSLNLRRRHLNESQRGMVAAKIANLPQHGQTSTRDSGIPLSQKDVSQLLNVSVDTVKCAKRVINRGIPELADAVEAGEVAASVAAEVAEEEPEEQAAILRECDRKDISRAARRLKEEKREKRREAQQQERKRVAAEAARATPPGDDQCVRRADFRELADELAPDSVDLIFTDPPYDRASVPLYADLGAVAARVLKPGGSLVTYLGMVHLPEVVAHLTPHLRFWWPLCCYHTGPTSLRMFEFGVVNKWKPMLWFVKGTRGDKLTFLDDLVVSAPEKDAHEWQQGLAEAAYYIEKLTPPGGFVFDPFCGGGTTAVAAKKLGRVWLTCDTDGDSVSIARKRVLETPRD